VKGASTQASNSGGFSLSPIAKARTESQDLRKPDTKVLSENSVKYWTTLGGPRKIRELRKETGVAATLCRARGVVEAKDLVTGDKAIVLWNAGSRYQVEVEDFTTANTLPIFSLIFTEFESEGFLFHTTWQWEVGTWRECVGRIYTRAARLGSASHHLRGGKERNSRDMEAFHVNKLIGNLGAVEGPGIHAAEHPICSRYRWRNSSSRQKDKLSSGGRRHGFYIVGGRGVLA
jgi:hemin uptake protein HemP